MRSLTWHPCTPLRQESLKMRNLLHEFTTNPGSSILGFR